MSRMPNTFESNAPIFTVNSKKKESDAIAKQTRKFLRQQGKIQLINEGVITKEYFTKGKQTTADAKARWSNNKGHTEKK